MGVAVSRAFIPPCNLNWRSPALGPDIHMIWIGTLASYSGCSAPCVVLSRRDNSKMRASTESAGTAVVYKGNYVGKHAAIAPSRCK
ncbi:hypothetical protein EGD00_09780 [Pectobacterium carotovorum subsp. carotovorum]|nr:hypothetical protein EGD00_09780 [Pectobacterium carotovorum subsp. carotovorum]